MDPGASGVRCAARMCLRRLPRRVAHPMKQASDLYNVKRDSVTHGERGSHARGENSSTLRSFMTAPRVSVIVPAYDAETTLPAEWAR